MGSTPVHRGILHREEFEGGEGALDGRRPEITKQGASWIATGSFSRFSANGGFVGMGKNSDVERGGSATLRFEPIAGVRYTLDASISGLGGSPGWLALGFAKGQSSRAGKDCRFLGPTVAGRAWLLLTGSTINQSCGAVLGTTGSNGGVADRMPWAGWDDGVVDDVVHARLEADGSLAFFMENGRYDVLLTSEVGVADGDWHHVAAAWSPSTVVLYIDGRRAGIDNEFRGNQHGQLRALRFGGGAEKRGVAPFSGWLDEIALWKRPLTPVEIAEQFQAARAGRGATASDPPVNRLR